MKNNPKLFSKSNTERPQRERLPRIYPTVSAPIISSSDTANYDLQVIDMMPIGRNTPTTANSDDAEVSIGCCTVS
jgi:hypothetical protein